MKMTTKNNSYYLGSYPDKKTYSAIGGFLDHNNPLVCGGSIELLLAHSLCYALDKSRIVSTMDKERLFAASLLILVDTEPNKLWVTGGETWISNFYRGLTPTGSTEYLTMEPGGDVIKSTPGPSIHNGIGGHCLLQLNETTALLTGGMHINVSFTSSGTFFYNIEKQMLSVGPKIINPRISHACGLVTLGPSKSNLKAAAITGGKSSWIDGSVTQTTELLVVQQAGDGGTTFNPGDPAWSQGPDFPHVQCIGSASVTAPDGTLVVTGGYDSTAPTTIIVQLDCRSGLSIQDCHWNKLQIELPLALADHIALLVPEGLNFDRTDDSNGSDTQPNDVLTNEQGNFHNNEMTPTEVLSTVTSVDNSSLFLLTGGRIGVGYFSGYGFDTEVYDASAMEKQCNVADKYLTHERILGVGGFIYGQPMVCGGGEKNLRENVHVYSGCEWLGSKPGNVPMREKRLRASSILITKQNGIEQKLWLAGGERLSKQPLRTTEFVSPVKRFAGPGPSLPIPLTGHCAVKLNQSTVMILGGRRAPRLNWFFFDIEREVLSQGQRLSNHRYFHVCGQVALGQGQKVVVMAGGYAPMTAKTGSSEILVRTNDGNLRWKNGPKLPIPIQYGVGVSIPSNGRFLLAGGKTGGQTGGYTLAYIYQLACPTDKIRDCKWTRFDREMVGARYHHVGMIVPSNFASCT